MKRKVTTLSVAALFIAGCAPDPDALDGNGANGEEGGSGGTLRIGQEYDLGTLDPAVLSAVGDRQMTANIFEGLLRFEYGTLEIEPALATAWESNEEGTEWTFQLREGVQFHDGYGEMSADDVVFSFERVLDEATGSPNRSLLTTISEIRAEDDYTVVFEMSEPDPSFEYKLTDWYTSIVSREAVEELGDDFQHNPIGTGRYQFENWTQGQETVTVAFEDHWEGEPNLDEVIYRAIPDATTRHNSFMAGEIDVNQVTDPEIYAQIEDVEGVSIEQVPGLITRFMGVKADEPPFDDERVREAISYAINRPAMMDGIFSGISTPAEGILSPDVDHALTGILDYEYDPDRALELLEEAGYDDGVDVTLTIGDVDRFTRPATVIQQNLAEVGINMEIVTVESQTMLDQLRSDDGLQMYLLSRGQDPAPDRVLGTWFHSDGIPSNNWARIDDEEVDAWLDEAMSTMDMDRRDELFGNVQEYVAEGHYLYFIDHEDFIFAVQDRVGGFQSDPQRSLRLDDVTIQD
ncbi:ABC transporter substrate-binding protein [Nesterenkonia ebinurensis]|uniref:ABC transporter substrate-binding protein n=1 Tax=Nesterenkonia ebinurensis TaxID=2608252 RepID=UPI00168AC0F3|nr:ABC transporter substrate-binding protein [Nesterenkonia ebinurensis]